MGLDPKASHLLKGMMREICDAGGAIFFSTHVLEVAEKLCDKVAIIKGGKLIRSGTMMLLFVGFMLLPGWMLGFLGYMRCFAEANLLLSVPIYLWLRKQGVACFSAL